MSPSLYPPPWVGGDWSGVAEDSAAPRVLCNQPKAPKALDLFCGAGGVSMGLHRAGFDVTGIDLHPQPQYPFAFIQADALAPPLRLQDFDLICASPPCQAYTMSRRIRIENVPGAPLRRPIELCGAMFGLSTYRHRLFEASFPIKQPWHLAHELIAAQTKMGRRPKDGEFIQVVGNFSDVGAARKAMGIHWMSRDRLAQAIPPAYSEFIGRAFLAQREVAPASAFGSDRAPAVRPSAGATP